ncbi:hypothetical protein VNO77_33348 [Canavalia gladiata]|uniref:AT3G52170-like helix-turn-helix domain-containing protein n=1 Tax=Canavalia gladiata TaxID=3824 RepID=A0AAN9KC75_CANGL
MRKKLLIASTKGLSFRSNHHFTTLQPKHLSFEVCNSVDSLKVQQRGWSYAASVPSEAPAIQKGRKKVTRHERRAMVESYVNKYRAENAGKFPGPRDTRHQVGGSYYIVRQIIQELQYKSKMNSSNSMGGILVEKQFDESKLLTSESVNASSGNIEIAKDKPIQNDSQSVVLDDKEIVDTGYEHLEGKRGPQTLHWNRRLFEEVEIMSTPSNHCIASESNLMEECSSESKPSGLHMPNDIKNEKAFPSYSDSVAPKSQPLEEKTEHFSPLFNENYGTDYRKAQDPEYDSIDMTSHQKMEENCINKQGYEGREQPDLEDLSRELSQPSLQVPNDVEGGEAVSRSSDSVTQERHLLKKEIEHYSAPFIEKSGSSCSKDQSHDTMFVDMENNPATEKRSFEKAGNERKEQDTLGDLPGVDDPKHKMEQSQRSSELDESKIDNPNNMETSVAAGSEKSNLWGNLKSFANGIINIWRRL